MGWICTTDEVNEKCMHIGREYKAAAEL